MQEHALPTPGSHDSLDRCDRCECIFLDYFDGDPGEVVRDLHSHRGLQAAGTPAITSSPSCPDCERAMVLRRYLDGPAELFRCDECAAAFLTPGMMRDLLKLEHTVEPSSLLSRFLHWFDSLR